MPASAHDFALLAQPNREISSWCRCCACVVARWTGNGFVEEGSERQCFRSAAALRCTSSAAAWSDSTWEQAGGEARSKEEGRRWCSGAHLGRGKATVAAAASVTGHGQEDQGPQWVVCGPW
jgi:hypothetical protein